MKKPLMILTVACSLFLLVGCGGESAGGSSQTTPDYAAEAKKEINADNMDRHLEALEAEIAADEAAIQD